ncbi:hypothetical protein CYY_000611 [Polysphondylium violaceum]|uniref:Protein phosphatase methylesterase 1 n=1 Tax=Polysphondylium violaceum TaxID=133409 RepID=A0A8J4V286_9MYCE|nr:hypothetical protein CYY_000611 [Polysphondylium violaceum]
MFRGIYKGNLPPIDPSTIHQNIPNDDSHYYKEDWDKYFESSRELKVPDTDNTFKIYESNIQITKDAFLLVFIHGGGYTSLSWSLVTDLLNKLNHKNSGREIPFRVLCYDSRAHGLTKTSNDNDFSITTLVDDCCSLVNYYLKTLYQDGDNGSNDGDSSSPSSSISNLKVVLIGHSMGGAVAVKAACSNKIENLTGLVVLDVVEGTAMSALSSMRSVLAKRPKSFESVSDAIKWSISSNTIHNLQSARVSVPSQIVYNEKDKRYHWITPLENSEPFWNDWFTGLSKEFLSNRATKLLILAGTDRLDKELTIAQMQGRFQLVVLQACGHVIQEDNPNSTANSLLEYLSRQKL